MPRNTGKLSGSLKTAEVPAEVKLATGRPRDRDETQQVIDAATETLMKAWEAAGKPTYEALTASTEDTPQSQAFTDSAKQAYTVDKKDRSALKGMIRRATTLHKGAPVYAADVVNDKDGTVTVIYTYAPPPVKAESDGDASENPAPDANADEGNGDAGGDGDTPPADEENPPGENPGSGRGRRWGNR
jgi:hypothetical protein